MLCADPSENSFEDALLDKPEDPRFRTFVQQLDPENKQIQACFRSLVQVGLQSTGSLVSSLKKANELRLETSSRTPTPPPPQPAVSCPA